MKHRIASPYSLLTCLLLLSGLLVFNPITKAQDEKKDAKTEETKEPRINRFIELMENGKNAFGAFSTNVSLRDGAAIQRSGLDFVILDLEHSPYDITKLENYLAGMTSKADVLKNGLQLQTTPVIRLPANGREQLQFVIKQVLDLGTMGILIPHVDSAEDALAMVQASRFGQLQGSPDFKPEGKRGVGYGWAARQWGLSGGDYARRADLWPLDPEGELMLWVMIETVDAVKNARAIAQTPGVTGLFVGPGDLAYSMGVPLGDPAVETEIDKVLEATKDLDILLGTVSSKSDVEKRLEQGFRFLTVGSIGGLPAGTQEAMRMGRAYKKK